MFPKVELHGACKCYGGGVRDMHRNSFHLWTPGYNIIVQSPFLAGRLAAGVLVSMGGGLAFWLLVLLLVDAQRYE